MDKIELEIKSIIEADERIYILTFISKHPEYVSFLVIRSLNDDILGNDEEKDRWRDYFVEKYTLDFIDAKTMGKFDR